MQVTIFADGASKGNPGLGGWGSIVATPDAIHELGGHVFPATNNQMELTSIISGLTYATTLHPTSIDVYMDSIYVMKGITEWIDNWIDNEWQTSAGQPVANQEMWKTLLALVANQTISWHYTKGHAGIPGNERVDFIADQFSLKKDPNLCTGPRVNYRYDLTSLPDDTSYL